MSAALINKDIEKHVLASFVKYPNAVIDYLATVRDKWFACEGHALIFKCIVHLDNSRKPIDRLSIGEYFHNLGTKHIDGVVIDDYIDAIQGLYNLEESKVPYYIETLKKYYIAREAYESFRIGQQNIIKNLNNSIEELVSGIQADQIEINNSDVCDSMETSTIYDTMREYLYMEIDRPRGVQLPFPLFHKRYGALSSANCYVIVADYGAGKSTLLDYLGKKCPLMPENQCRTLYIDTELTRQMNISRTMAAATRKNEWFFSDRSAMAWRKDEFLKEKGDKMLEYFESCDPNSFHYKSMGITRTSDLVSVIRRWVHKHVQDDVVPLIILDYLKILGENVKDGYHSYMLFGEKTNALHQLAKELGAVILFAVQENSDGKTSGSRMIPQLCSNLFYLKKKTPEQLLEHGTEFGTHVLIPEKTRLQGEEAAGFNDKIRVPISNDKYEYRVNYLNFEFSNFKVQERGDLAMIVKRSAGPLVAS